jgi:hypothetical protein
VLPDNTGHQIRARRPTTIPCERSGCLEALDLRTFFVCDGCRQRLCPGHRSAATDRCDHCVSSATAPPLAFSAPPPPPAAIPGTMQFDPAKVLTPRDMMETHEGNGPLGDQDMIETQEDEDDPFDSEPNPFDKGQQAPDPFDKGSLSPDPNVAVDPFAGELGQVRFECPYCETRLAPHARECPSCKKSL